MKISHEMALKACFASVVWRVKMKLGVRVEFNVTRDLI